MNFLPGWEISTPSHDAKKTVFNGCNGRYVFCVSMGRAVYAAKLHFRINT